MASLEEKIAILSPDLRIQLEDYVDFLLSRQDDSSHVFVSPGCSEKADDVLFKTSDIPITKDHVSGDVPFSQGNEKKKSSGIILAEERISHPDNPDYIDFADINSRFGHIPKDEEEQKGPSRLRRLLDWM